MSGNFLNTWAAVSDRFEDRMCVTPRKWNIDGVTVEVCCSKCWACRNNRASDWTGRAIAESENASAVRFVTLTYGDDNRVGVIPNEFAATSLVKRDVQLWIRRIRKAGYSVRYLIAGEYGPAKGRTHWHAILYFQGRAPDIPLNTRLHGGDEFWKLGITYWADFTVGAAFYTCKYLLKAQTVDNRLLRSEKELQSDNQKQGWATLSRRPPLGAKYFQQRAEIYVRNGLAPQDLEYSFPEVYTARSGSAKHTTPGMKERKKEKQRFYLKRGSASADLFLRHFVDKWRETYGTHPPQSEIVEEYLDRMARPDGVAQLRLLRMKSRPPFLPDGGSEADGGSGLIFVETLNSYGCDVSLTGTPVRLFWSYDADGRPAWVASIVSEAEASLRRERAKLARDPDAYRKASKGD